MAIYIKKKVREWLGRYLVPEILSSIITILAASVAYKATEDKITTALAATWGGNIAYFGYILFSDIAQAWVKARSVGKSYTGVDVLKNVRALVIEFGIAEIVDSFFVRPTFMYYFPIWFHNLSLGVFLAKIAADITFYIPAIIGYELNKEYQLEKK